MGAAEGRYQCRWHSFPAILRSLSGAPHGLARQPGTEQARPGVRSRDRGMGWGGRVCEVLSPYSSCFVHRGRRCQHQHVLQRDPDRAWALGLPSAGGQGLQHAAHHLPGECALSTAWHPQGPSLCAPAPGSLSSLSSGRCWGALGCLGPEESQWRPGAWVGWGRGGAGGWEALGLLCCLPFSFLCSQQNGRAKPEI